MAYYTEYIKRNPKWRFAGIYADEGITGTQVKKRDEFLSMIEDCENGKIDLILTKSVSRYARNIVDCISYIRKLKALGIGIYFEEQNINSLTEDSEVYIGIYGVLTQSESENISANVKWGINKRMQNGTYNGKSVWDKSTVKGILINEKYIGDVLGIRKKVMKAVRRRGVLKKRYCTLRFAVA